MWPYGRDWQRPGERTSETAPRETSEKPPLNDLDQGHLWHDSWYRNVAHLVMLGMGWRPVCADDVAGAGAGVAAHPDVDPVDGRADQRGVLHADSPRARDKPDTIAAVAGENQVTNRAQAVVQDTSKLSAVSQQFGR
jgi:hypothetical protein